MALSGILAGVIFVIGAVVTRKCLVAPESSITQSFIYFVLMSTVNKIVLAAYLSRLLCVFFVFVVFGGVHLFIRIHAYGFSHPIGGFGVPTYLSVLSFGILWRFWGIM